MTTVDLKKTPARPALDRLRPVGPPAPPPDPDALIAPWLRSWPAFRATSWLFMRREGRRLLSILMWLPIYLARCIKYAPRGLGRLIARFSKWVYDSDTAILRHDHTGTGDTGEAQKAHAMRRANLHARFLVLSTVAVVIGGPILVWTYPKYLAGGLAVMLALFVMKLIKGKSIEEFIFGCALGVVAYFLLVWAFEQIVLSVPLPPFWTLYVLGGLTLIGLGEVGRPTGQSLVRTGEIHTGNVVQKPTPDLVIEALCRIGVPGMTPNKLDEVKAETRVIAPGVARSRRGYHLQLELPWGCTVSQVAEHREELAAALKRHLGTVWPSKGPRHPGHLELFLSDVPMASAPQEPWPLAKGERVDIFNPLQQFTDQEGNWVDFTIAGKRILIGGASGTGKSYYTRQLGIAAAFDPRVRIVCIDGKVNGDLDCLIPVAHGFYVGNEPDEIAEQLAALRGIEKEMRRRARFLRTLPAEENPQKKVTSSLVDSYPHLAPILLLLDEVQEYTEHENKEIRDEFIRIFTAFARLGRSSAIIPVFCTQKPDAKVLPTSITSNCSTRCCLKVQDSGHVDQVLGNGSHKNGMQSNKFSASDYGLAWFRGDGEEPQIVRSVWGLEGATAEELVARARAMRERLGLLTGAAAGEQEVIEPDPDVLDDVREVLNENSGRSMSLAQIVEALGLMRSAFYGKWDTDTLGAALRAAGYGDIRSVHVKVDGKNTSPKGVSWDQLIEAIERRDGGSDLTDGSDDTVRPLTRKNRRSGS